MSESTTTTTTPTARIVLAWLVPVIPLAYGLYNTLKSALKLFTQ
ncbi:MFS transporter small subunit [Knoellia koreensis]|uniref:Oxalate:formate antiporter n=1 Tax=Knoellia koreensis TaxID=2730921 RepID=A0A849HEK6_9MICO|nr:oxalate:formate antiporter [Knoellia sp. DB2414S]NNM45828.1 oxalate:formate antiporter [Knoellia sp. DB2414S]